MIQHRRLVSIVRAAPQFKTSEEYAEQIDGYLRRRKSPLVTTRDLRRARRVVRAEWLQDALARGVRLATAELAEVAARHGRVRVPTTRALLEIIRRELRRK